MCVKGSLSTELCIETMIFYKQNIFQWQMHYITVNLTNLLYLTVKNYFSSLELKLIYTNRWQFQLLTSRNSLNEIYTT